MSQMTSSNLPGLAAFVNSMIGLAVAIGFLVIFLSMYTTVTERTREVGVLKSLGASKGLHRARDPERNYVAVYTRNRVGILSAYFVRAFFETSFQR